VWGPALSSERFDQACVIILEVSTCALTGQHVISSDGNGTSRALSADASGRSDFLEPGRFYRARTGLGIAHHLTPEKNVCYNQVGLNQKGKDPQIESRIGERLLTILPGNFIAHHIKIFYKIDS
jgi:hypothetical protein